MHNEKELITVLNCLLGKKEIKNRNNSYIHSVVIQTDPSAFPRNNITTQFMWDEKLPLKRVFQEIRGSRQMSYVKGWVYSGKIFKKYGSFLIRKYPFKFFRHFAIYNIRNIFYPPLEIFDHYAEYEPEKTLTAWFNLGEEKFIPRWNFFMLYIAPILTVMNLIHWLLAIAFLVYALVRRKDIKLPGIQRNIFIFLFAFIIVYLAFHVIAGPITLRYLTPVFFIKVMVPYFLLNGLLIIKEKTPITVS